MGDSGNEANTGAAGGRARLGVVRWPAVPCGQDYSGGGPVASFPDSNEEFVWMSVAPMGQPLADCLF